MYLCVGGAVLVPVVEIQSATIRNVVTDAYLTRFAPATKARLTDRGSYHEMKYQSKLANAGEIKVLVSESRPEIMLAKWDEEVAMTVTYDNLKARGQRDLLTNTVKWKGNQEEVHAYPLEPAFGMEDGGFEIEIELLEPPQKNVFDFRIAGAEDLDFFYQPPLTEEYIAGETCIDIVCTNATTGEITRMRPENAVGSYAVYHKNKKDHIRGKKNYGTGKVMHIYRPLVIDANGNSVWGSLSYQNGKLSVTVPPEFLAIATYPVIVDPTFGYTTAGTAGTNTIKNTMVFAYASSTSDGTLDSISYYEGAVAGTKYSKLALYSSNSATDVNALIATTSEITVLNTDDNTLQTATFPATGPSITAGTNYFFAVVGSAAIGAHTIAYDNGTLSVASTLVNTYTNSPTFPNTISGEGNATARVSMYGTYTEAATLSIIQNDWRWYTNANSVQPGTALASENATTTGVDTGDIIRLRMNLAVSGAAMATSTKMFRLQYTVGPTCATTTAGWNDVVATSTGKTGQPWVQADNATPADGATTTSLLLTSSTVLESYEEANPTLANLKQIPDGGYGEWDWVIKNNGALANTAYCFRMINSDHTVLTGYQSDSYARLTTSSSSVTQLAYRWRDDDGGEGADTEFGSGGATSSDPSTRDDDTRDFAINDGYLYNLVTDFSPSAINMKWRIEKREAATGEYVAAFGVNGATTTDPSTSFDIPYRIKVDASYMYIAGVDDVGGDYEWRIEKRNKTTGAYVSAFGTNGVLNVDPGAAVDDEFVALAIDGSYLYLSGIQNNGGINRDWRLEKRDITTGSLVTSFGTSGVIVSETSTSYDAPWGITVESGFIYTFGFDINSGSSQWRLEKRDATTGSLMTGFGNSGVITNNISSAADQLTDIAVTGEYIYLIGKAEDITSPATNASIHIEKRNLFTGALCTGASTCSDGAFDSDGVIVINLGDYDDIGAAITLTGDDLFVVGKGENSATDQYMWLQKRNAITGALCSSLTNCPSGVFSGDGEFTADPSTGDDEFRVIKASGQYIYIGGLTSNTVTGSSSAWYEKRYQDDSSLISGTTSSATWLAAQNASTTVELEDNLRLRFIIANDGNVQRNQRYQLEIATKGGAASCEAVSSGSYAAVPAASSCGSSVACMVDAVVSDGGRTTPQLSASGDFVYGKAIENASNKSATTTLYSGQYTELEYAFAFTSYAATSTSYCARLTDEGTPLDSYTKVAEVKTAGSVLLRNHTSGQVSDAFDSSSETNKPLYAFKLIPDEEDVTVTDLVFDILGSKRITVSDFSNIRLFKDNDSDGIYDASGDTQVGGSGVMSITGQTGAITFTGDFLATSSQNYLLIADWTAPNNNSFMTLQLNKSDLVAVGATTGRTKRFEGAVAAIQHSRNSSGGGSSGAQGNIGGEAPAGAGVVSGGGQGGGNNVDTNTNGATIGNETGYFWPTTQSGSWNSPNLAYDQTDGTYASTTAATTQTYSIFNFGIPAGNRVNGVAVKLEVSGTTAAGTIDTALSWDGGTSWTTAKTTPTLTTTDTVRTLGGASDTWGRASGAWIVSHFNTANFRLRLTGAPSSNTVQVDALQVKVYHEATGGGGGGGGGGEI